MRPPAFWQAFLSAKPVSPKRWVFMKEGPGWRGGRANLEGRAGWKKKGLLLVKQRRGGEGRSKSGDEPGSHHPGGRSGGPQNIKAFAKYGRRVLTESYTVTQSTLGLLMVWGGSCRRDFFRTDFLRLCMNFLCAGREGGVLSRRGRKSTFSGGIVGD